MGELWFLFIREQILPIKVPSVAVLTRYGWSVQCLGLQKGKNKSPIPSSPIPLYPYLTMSSSRPTDQETKTCLRAIEAQWNRCGENNRDERPP